MKTPRPLINGTRFNEPLTTAPAKARASWLTGLSAGADVCTAPVGCASARLIPGSPPAPIADEGVIEPREQGLSSKKEISAGCCPTGTGPAAAADISRQKKRGTDASNCIWRHDPNEMLDEVKAGHFTDENKEWLKKAVNVFIETEGKVSLERALGLPCGQRAKETRRNYWLCIAHKLCAGDLSWDRAKTLESEIEKFCRIAPRGRLRKGCDESELSELQMALLHAHQQSCSVPSSFRQLWTIVVAGKS